MRDTPFKCLPHGAIGVSTSGNIWNVNLLGNLNDVQNTLKSTTLNAQPFGLQISSLKYNNISSTPS